MPSKATITLYGNFGFTAPDREVLAFSIAVSKNDAAGNDVTR
jgi:hypothetical protein